MRYFDYEIFGELVNAEYVDNYGLFIGNHHYPVTEAMIYDQLVSNQMYNLFIGCREDFTAKHQ